MKFTGERYLPGVEGFIKSEHIHRYILASEYVENKLVLDIACGEGYGSNLLASRADKVIGCDFDTKSINHANGKYKKKNLQFDQGCITQLPYQDHTFDVIICFETIEHVENYNLAMKELQRVLKESGILIMSTPNKSEYSDKRNFNNIFHKHEFYIAEYKEWLISVFKFNTFLYQKPIFGSIIQNFEKTIITSYKGDLEEYNSFSFNEFKYIISISSNVNVIIVPTSHYYDNNYQAYISNQIKGSLSYKIGHYILFPFKLIKKWIQSLL